MHDPEFEKEVQKRMEELEFAPSEGVWMNLQRGLHKEQRRRAPMFWLFFLLGGILLGAGGASLFYFHRAPSTISGEEVTAKRTGSIPAGAALIETAPASFETAPASGAKSMAGSKSPTVTPVVTGTAAGVKAGARTMEARMMGARMMGGTTMRARTMGAAADGDARFAVGMKTGQGGDEPDAPAMHSVALAPIGLLLHPDLSGDIAFQPGKDLPNTAYAKGLMAMSPVATMNKRAAKKARFTAHPSWEAGFAGGGGVSSATIPGSSSANPDLQGVITLSNSLQSPASSGGHFDLRISRIQPDLSFWAGIFVQRPVMKRLSFAAGLNLHYYTTRLETIEQKSTYSNYPTQPSLSSGYFTPSPYVQPLPAGSPYYGTGNYKFSNHYYFLQLPVSLQWQVNRSRKTPIYWEGGLAFSRLISANALYYNEKSGVYYRDGGGANPNHLMAFSSLMIGLSMRGNSIKIGPEGQYGLTSLINTGNVGNQHLFYGGIKITVIPKRW